MRNIPAAMLFAIPLVSAASWTSAEDVPKRTMPHQEECAVPLPADFWDNSAARRFESAESWAWNKRICLGQVADMRHAPGGNGQGKECRPTEIEKKGEAVPVHRQLRPEFLELILSHEPWASAPRRPQVIARCALVRGDIDLDDHRVSPTFGFHQGRIEGEIGLRGADLQRSLSLQGTTVTGSFNADRLNVGGGLFLRDGAAFADINLTGARIADNAELGGSTVSGTLNAERLAVGGALLLGGGTFAGIRLLGAEISGDADLTGATVTGTLVANRMTVGGGLYLSDASTSQGMSLPGASIGRDMMLNGATVKGLLTADGLKVGGSLFLRDADMLAGLRLSGATIEGDADLIGATVTGKLNADSLEAGRRLLLRSGSFLAEVRLVDAIIAGDVDMAGVTVTKELEADGLHAGGNLVLRKGTFADIDLPGARIAGDAELSGTTLTGKLAGDGLEIGGGLFLRNGGSFAEVSLPGARIGSIVQLVGGTFNGEINLTGATIGVELHLGSAWSGRSPTWQEGASLVLRNAKADVLQARAENWNMSGADGLVPTDLTGFTFNRLGGLDTSGGASMGDRPADWLVGWIEAQRDHGEIHDPQPYTHLAQVLEAAGAKDKADAIRYARFEHQRDHDQSMNAMRYVGLEFYRLFLGYGLHPFRMLCWFAGLVLLGWLLVRFSKDASVRGANGLWYSLEIALPLIETSERFRNVDHRQPRLAHWFHFQKAVGFVFATILVGALALLSG